MEIITDLRNFGFLELCKEIEDIRNRLSELNKFVIDRQTHLYEFLEWDFKNNKWIPKKSKEGTKDCKRSKS